MTRVILIRHGQTPWNKDKIFRGIKDVPLDETGIREAELLGDWLRDEKIDVAYSSPLVRSMETCRNAVRHHGLEVVPLKGLTDLNYGDWGGVSLEDVKVRWAELYETWKKEPHKVTFPGGESLGDLRAKAMAALDWVAAAHPGKSAILCGHRVVNKVIILGVLGLPSSEFWRIGQDTTAYNVFTWDGERWIINLMNDTCHLKALGPREYVDF